MSVALLIIIAFLVVAVGLALRARRGRDMDLEQWTAGGRGFGTIFVFLLMAGEIYSTFTFLGGAGLVYGSGGAAYYILGYGTLAYILSYWLLPAVWRYATPRKLLSQSDFCVSQHDSRALGVIVSLVAVAAMIPYLALQLKGLGIIVDATSYGSISSTAAGRVRRRVAAAEARRGRDRLRAARHLQAGVPAVVRGADRLGGDAVRSGARLDAADRLRDHRGAQHLPRRAAGRLRGDRALLDQGARAGRRAGARWRGSSPGWRWSPGCRSPARGRSRRFERAGEGVKIEN
jgi:hypothetical protein